MTSYEDLVEVNKRLTEENARLNRLLDELVADMKRIYAMAGGE